MKNRLSLLVIATILSCFHLAAAAPSPADRTAARKLAHQAQAAFVDGDYQDAEQKFRQAYELLPAPTLLLGLARAQYKQGLFVEAYENYLKIIREGVEKNAPWAFKRALKDAEVESADLEPRLAWMTIQVSGVDEDDRGKLELELDDKDYPVAALGIERPANPGAHVFRAAAEGYEGAETTFTLEEGQHAEAIRLELVKLPEPETPGEEALPVDQQLPQDTGQTQRVISYVALGVGGAALIAGGITGAIAVQKHSDLESRCGTDGTCPGSEQAAVDEYRNFGLAATIGLAAGAVATGAGLYLLLGPDLGMDSPNDGPSENGGTALNIRPYLGFGTVGAVGSF